MERDTGVTGKAELAGASLTLVVANPSVRACSPCRADGVKRSRFGAGICGMGDWRLSKKPIPRLAKARPAQSVRVMMLARRSG